MSARAARVAIAAVVAAGLLLRLRSVASPGFPTDVSTFMAWAERLADLGPRGFYEPGYFSDYPPGFLYVLWALGAALDGEALRLAVKGASIPFDLAIALVVAALAWRAATPAHGVLAAALWLFAPGVVFAGAHWGQVDAVGTLPLLLALVAAGRGRWAAAGALAGLAAMIKPQFGLGLVIVMAAAAFAFIRLADARPALRAGAAAAAVVLGLGLPFGSGPFELIALVRSASETYPYTSLYAFNPWSVALGFWKPDEGWVVAGAALLLAGVGAACAPLWWRRDVATFLAAGALAVLAFYFLPTRAHERYVFPALALLVPFAALRARILWPYLGLQAGFLASLAVVFTVYDLLEPPGVLRATLLSRAGEVALALAMTAAAGYVAWRLARGDARLEPSLALAAPRPAGPAGRWSLPPGLRPGYAPTRRDVLVALLVALLVLATRGFRLDHPRDMYFDEVYHARTAYELLAGREAYEWTHPHLAKEAMALGILLFSADRVERTEAVPEDLVALAVTSEGLRVLARADGTVLVRDRAGRERGSLSLGERPLAVATDADRVVVATARELVTASLLAGDLGEVRREALPAPPTSLAVAGGRVLVGSARGLEVRGGGAPLAVSGDVVAVTARPDGTAAYLLEADGRVRVIDLSTGSETRSFAGGPGRSIAYVLSPDRLLVGGSGATVDVVDLGAGTRERATLESRRTGALTGPVTALATVPRTQFVYALAGDRLVVVEPHGLSPYATIPVAGSLLAVAGEEDALVVAGPGRAELVGTGRQALAWRLPGVAAAAFLAFMLVLLARRLFASPLAPALAGAVVLLDGSMYAQARIGMNDVYVAAFLVGGWYFVVAAHAPRRSAWVDLLLAGVFFGLALASKWVAAYALAALGLLSLGVTARAYLRGRPGEGGPLDLAGRRGLAAVSLFAAFAVLPLAIYVLSYLPGSGIPTIPFGWSLWELTQQMYWYHSGLTAPHPAGSPWWSWPFVLKPVYWYYGASDGGSAVIYDAGNVVLFWTALAATVWVAVAAVRARSVALGFVLVALLAQLVAWIPITRVLFFYHFFTALPFYFLALTAALVALAASGRRALVAALLALATAAFVFFYPFVSGVPVPADQTGIFFILPTWQYDCQFYPSFTCAVPLGGTVGAEGVIARLAPALALLAVAAGVWLAASDARVRRAVAERWPRGSFPPR